MTESNGKTVISAKISDVTVASLDEIMTYLDIKTRQELIKRAIDLYISTFKFACDRNNVRRPFRGNPDYNPSFTADGGKKSNGDEVQHVMPAMSVKSGECDDCGRFNTNLVHHKSIYQNKWICPICMKKYRPMTDSD